MRLRLIPKRHKADVTDPQSRRQELAHARQLLLDAMLLEYEIQAYHTGKVPEIQR